MIKLGALVKSLMMCHLVNQMKTVINLKMFRMLQIGLIVDKSAVSILRNLQYSSISGNILIVHHIISIFICFVPNSYFFLAVLGLFNLIQFENARCNSTDSDKQGICYTASECAGRGGNAKGTCAAGFGVCCLCELL